MRHLFTSESVTQGHPDKLCDQVSDAVLDALLALDPLARVACEVCVAADRMLLMGEITSKACVPFEQIARDVIQQAGYHSAQAGFDGNACLIQTAFSGQSPDIALGVDDAYETRGTSVRETGAGDQGMMFGFACDETPELMPLPISLAHKLTRRLADLRQSGQLPWLRPDGKSQVTVLYDNGRPVEVDAIVLSAQHAEDVSMDLLRSALLDLVIRGVIDETLLTSRTRLYINPTGRFVVGGPAGDTGLTGRKIIVDTYGGYAPHGGGSFSGKDPTKVDRSAAYAARHAAKNLVAAGLCGACEIQIAYAIGMAKPVSLFVNSRGTGRLPDTRLAEIVSHEFNLQPGAIINRFNLRRPIYQQTAAYGHFGRLDADFPWERTDQADMLRDKYY